ncbi:B12-binding domain-containing radical SAM protein [Clostridium estertheticum]|uniref:B12-binding domain-containing radical SAM protein n=1 Tax=Clostridium estertheticum TaxID=238834 RepID=UPI00124E627A|nr:radical SAM protein [Clostridium estertheticum]MBU3171913.1 B12-binding domain-containing radical SAM protein [Clostridium estertheticum]MBZ9618363.1 B12-binding domain-containing radical SAM protein [Clostridium estertheticum subsp. laramiense]WAG76140.1 B12-binding domain-containing radical SAM protein [Clostridium estertheticum]
MNEIDVLMLNLPTTSWYKDKFAKSNSMPPLGLLYIGTVLKKNNYTVKIIDFAVENFLKESFIAILEKLNPKVIGMSTYNESWKAQKIMCSLIKQVLPEVKIFAGGAFATFCYEDILNESETDYVIRGEGEYPVLDLCNIIFGKVQLNIMSVSGIVYKKMDNEICINENMKRIEDLDQLPFPDRELVDIEKYLLPYTISTARGCPGACIFCSSRAFWGKTVYIRSAKSVFNELMYLYNKYGATVFYITDDTFTASSKRVFEFCKMIKETKIKFVWGCESRADIITEELMRELSDSGCKKLQIGLESADNEILRKLKKLVTIEQIENGIKLAHRYGMHISASFIIGHAFDTNETIEKTIEFAKYIQSKYGAYVMGSVNTPFPGTEQYERAEELGIKIFTKKWDNYKLDNPIISTENISIEKLRYYHEMIINVMMQNNSINDANIVEDETYANA